MPALQPSGGFEWTQLPWGVALVCGPLASVARHVFTARNLGLRHVEDECGMVASALGIQPEDLLLVRQVHGRQAAVARRGRVAAWLRPEADLVVADDPGVAVGVHVADCAAILLADRRNGAVCAAHAGWRGTAARSAAAAVETLAREFGSAPMDLVAAIGPCLGPCCGEVGEEVVAAFRAAHHAAADINAWFSPGASGRPHFDLWRANQDQLIAAGVPAASVHVAALCTKCHPQSFHSYRAHGAAAGRMLGAIRSVGG